MFISGFVLIAMLIANVLFVKAFFAANLSGLDDRVFKAAQFVLPIIMIFIEFWIYDAIFTRNCREEKSPIRKLENVESRFSKGLKQSIRIENQK